MLALIFYAVFLTFLVSIRELGKRTSLNSFLTAERAVGGPWGSMSIAASWIWAPAIFISTMVGYRWGFSGLVWFTVPNMLALVIFAPLAAKVRSRVPEGVSYIDYLRPMGGSFWKLQCGLQLLLQIVIYAIQLTAGANMLALLTASSYSSLVILMALTPLVYTLRSGLRASVFTDGVQYLIIAIGAITLLANTPVGSFQLLSVRAGEFQPFDSAVLWNFGIASALSLLVAIFADQQQWQRAFACRDRAVEQTFFRAALMHGLVTATLGTFGVVIAQAGFVPANPEYVGVEYVRQYYSPMLHLVFVSMALCALISTLDSGLCAFSSLWSSQFWGPANSLGKSRLTMVVLLFLGAVLALSGLSLSSIWFLAGAIRLSSFVPTVASITIKQFNGRVATQAIIAALIVGIPVFGLGLFEGNASLRTWGMLLAIATSSLVLFVGHFFRRVKIHDYSSWEGRDVKWNCQR